MSDFRNRPKGTYLFEADWQALYALTEHWKSDLLFYKDDLKILHHLIDKYFLWISKKENLTNVRKIEESLNKIDKQCTSLLTRVSKHLHHLAELIDDPFKYDSHQFRTEHEILEDNIADFVKGFRQNRIDVFELIEQLMENEKLVK